MRILCTIIDIYMNVCKYECAHYKILGYSFEVFFEFKVINNNDFA
jgi:hypothetical protein